VTDTAFIVCRWAHSNGFRIVERRAFKTEWGARRFATEHSQGKTGQCTICLPPEPGSTYTTGTQVADYRNGIDRMADTEEPNPTSNGDTMSKDTKKPTTKKPVAKKAAPSPEAVADTGTPVAKASSKKAPATPSLLKIDADAVLEAAKSTDKTRRYDAAYLRFLTGLVRSCPSNPTSTGIASTDARNKRRAAIRKAVAQITQEASAKKAA
jgi:hypothetical protein